MEEIPENEELPLSEIVQAESARWIDEFQEKIHSRDEEYLIHFLEKNHPADIAEALSHAELDEIIYVFQLCDPEQQSLILVEFEEDLQSEIIGQLPLKAISPIVENLETDEFTNLISEISKEKAEEILNAIDLEDSSLIRKQLTFKEYTAGRLMNTNFVSINESDTVRKAIIKVRKAAREIDDVYLVYVTDDQRVLKGAITIKDLFLAPLNYKVARLYTDNGISNYFHYNTDQEEVAKAFQKYDMVSAPVVDDLGRILGRITVDDILDIVEEEASEDILRMGGVSEEERLNTPIWTSMRRRLTWLIINLGTASVAASVVSLFETTIGKIVVLASLMPVVAGMGGNAGTQSITVVVRNIATGSLSGGNWKQAIRKELAIGFLNGLALGLVTGAVVYLWKENLTLSVVMFSAMMINLIIAALVGSLIPLLLRMLRIDPAIASSIFVTTFTDVCGFFCFLGLASLFIGSL